MGSAWLSRFKMLFLLLLLGLCIRLLVLRSSGQADVKSPVSLLHRFQDLKFKLRVPSEDSAALQHAGAQAQYASWPSGWDCKFEASQGATTRVPLRGALRKGVALAVEPVDAVDFPSAL
mmetsp:Transcript_156937/g.500625  ORF Transcript_156937/g.500625 Transcript_156937/m.500625 type:complete len:119 (-) Transcript_156937:4-360(-)